MLTIRRSFNPNNSGPSKRDDCLSPSREEEFENLRIEELKTSMSDISLVSRRSSSTFLEDFERTDAMEEFLVKKDATETIAEKQKKSTKEVAMQVIPTDMAMDVNMRVAAVGDRAASLYRNFSPKHEIISCCEFIPITTLMPLLISVRKNIYVKASCAEIHQRFTDLRPAIVFDRNTRFPTTYHVNVTSGKIAKFFDFLRLVFDINEKYEISMADIRFILYDTVKSKVANIIDSIVKSNPHDLAVSGIFNRETFEKTYELQWG